MSEKVLHDAHVAAFKRTEKFRFACECRYVAGMGGSDRKDFLQLVEDKRGAAAVALIERGVSIVLDLRRGL